ncbi:hypothetical protein DFH07DRAFT_949490 [Mycena maculata]|uniref:PDZ domain-containing protein n=1 Tax=Mycena maculata TaxID=230809 RepID=A0AAD7NZU0_9AGAR|nr:hypothetical protein DFH07DRAFT_949490 [Mycena maculata]
MLARLRVQLSLQHRRSIGSSRKLPKTRLPASELAPPEPPTPTSESEPPKDFRSPWLFKAVGVGNFVIIPVVGIYAAFYWDWNDDGREHVMQPARRWLQRQKDAFFRLTPSEQELAAPGVVAPPLDGAESPAASGLSTAGLPKGFFKPFFLVKDVNPAGPAALAGLRDDDLIVSFGETPVRDLAPLTYQAMIWEAVKHHSAIPVVVMRPGKHVLVSLSPTKEAGLGCDLQRFQPGQVNR